MQQVDHLPNQGGFARAIGTQQPKDLALEYLERDVPVGRLVLAWIDLDQVSNVVDDQVGLLAASAD